MPFLRIPNREMLTEQGYIVPQTAGARNTKVPAELREIVEVKFDASYVVAFFNNAFMKLDFPTVSLDEFLERVARGANPLLPSDSNQVTTNEYQVIYERIMDEMATFAAMLPESGKGSRNPNDYTARWYQAVKFLERLETICNIEFKPKTLSKEDAQKQLARL